MYVQMTIKKESTELIALVTGFTRYQEENGCIENIFYLSSDARIWLGKYEKYFQCFTLTITADEEGTECSLTVRQEDGAGHFEFEADSVEFIEHLQLKHFNF